MIFSEREMKNTLNAVAINKPPSIKEMLLNAADQIRKEKDPNGIEAGEPGAKLDDGKILADDILRLFARALWEVCELGTYGAKKYSLGGWVHVPNGESRYANAQMRHKLKEWMGEEVDPDTELLHATADAWNALARLELILRRKAGSE